MTQNSEVFTKLEKLLDKRRGNGNIDILRYIVPDLIFLLAISVRYEEEEKKRPTWDVLNDPIWLTLNLPSESQWKNILKRIEGDPQKVKTHVYNALQAIEKVKIRKIALEDLTCKEHFNDPDLTDYDLQSIVSELNEIFQEHSWDYDFFGSVYQFFLHQFATRGGRSGGQFYTPSCVVKLLVNLLQPSEKSVVYDPCCGSGGMFVQSKSFIQDIKDNDKELICLGQELVPDTLRLAKRRLILEGITTFRLEQGDTLLEDKHSGQSADFVLANPPFNQAHNEMIEGDIRWQKYGFCKKNSNYGWITHIIHKLKPQGVGAVIMANATLSSSRDVEMRQRWLNDNLVEAIITLPNKLFYTTPIAPCIWVLRQGREATSKVLMIDISQDNFGEKKKGGERILTEKNIQQISEVYHSFRKGKWEKSDIPAVIVSHQEIEKNNFILVPSRYLSASEEKLTSEEIDEQLLKNTTELEELVQEQDKYHQELKDLLAKIKKEVENKD